MAPLGPSSAALELADGLRRREISAVELLDACLTAVDDRNPELNAVIWRNDDDARAAAEEADRRLAAGDDAPFPRRPDPDQGSHPRGGLAGQLRLARRAAGRQPRERARRRCPRSRRVRAVRPHEHARVRRHHRRREPPLRDQPQPLGHRPLARRLQRRRGSGRRRRNVPDRARQRRRRLDSHPRLLLRARRLQAEPRPRAAPRAELARSSRRGRRRTHGRRLRDGARCDRRRRPARLVQRARAGAPVRAGGWRGARAAAHRPDVTGAARRAHRGVLQRGRALGRRHARRARALRRRGRGADHLGGDGPAVHRPHAGRPRRVRRRGLVQGRAAHRPSAPREP